MGCDIMRWIFSMGLTPVLIGLLVGMAGATALATLFRIVLFGVLPTDPLTIGVVSLLLIGTACFACYIPARRASKLDPVVALRCE